MTIRESDSELPKTILDAFRHVRKILTLNPVLVDRRLIETEAEQILSSAYRKVTGNRLTRVDIHTLGRDLFPQRASRIAIEMAHDRSDGAILQHLTGVQEFLGREYDVGPDVLIPRPETEFLAFVALERLKRSRLSPPLRGFEVGSGSGVLSIELLAHFSELQMWATEFSEPAQTRARENADRILGVSSARLHTLTPGKASDVLRPFETLGFTGDFLISNPPYLQRSDEVDLDVSKNEPSLALYAPEGDPYLFYREIAKNAVSVLTELAPVFLEVPHERAGEIEDLFRAESWYTELVSDLTGRERILIANRKSSEVVMDTNNG